MERFVLRVDLSGILKNIHLQKVMILVDPQWPTVAEVANKIKKMFNINREIGFKNSEGGFFIPNDEPAEILKYVNGMLIAFQSDEINKATPIEEERTKNKTPRPDIVEPEIVTTAEFASKKKRKYGFLNEENFTTSTPNVEKERMPKRSRNANTSESPVTSELSKKKQQKRSKDTSDKALQGISNGKDTKSISKSQSKAAIAADIENSCVNSKNTKSHIFFESESKANHSKAGSDESTDDNVEPVKPKLEVVFLCDLTDNELTSQGRCFQICRKTAETKETNNSASKPKNRVSIVENLTLVKAAQDNAQKEQLNAHSIINSLERSESCLEDLTQATTSLMSDSSTVIDLSESEKSQSQIVSNFTKEEVYSSSSATAIESTGNHNETTTNETTQNGNSLINDSSLLDDSEDSVVKTVPLVELPKIYDEIIFKIILSNNKKSDSIVGICEYVNRRTKAIKIRLKKGQSQMRYVPQNYAGNVDDSTGLQILNVKLQDMIDPRVLQS